MDTKRRLLRCFVFVGLLFLICAYLFPQNKNAKKETSTKGRSRFEVKVNAVVINATVTDKAGNPVTDLTVRDFKLYEDGKPQNIQTFAVESIDPPELENAQAPSASPGASAQRNRQTPKQNAERPPRLISIIIDDLTMESATGVNRRPGSVLDFPRMVAAAKKFVKMDLSPTDQVCVLSGSRNLQLPFTDDKTRLLEELDAVPKKLNTISALRDQEKYAISDGEAWAIANGLNPDLPSIDQAKAEWKRTLAIRQNADVQSRTRNLLYTILLHLRVLSHFEGPKMAVPFSDGFITEPGPLTGAVEAQELQEIIDMALRSGIILNAVSIRGITAEGIFSTQDFSTPTPFSAFAMSAKQRQQEQAQEQHDQEQDQLLGVGTMPDDTPMQEKPMAQLRLKREASFFPAAIICIQDSRRLLTAGITITF